MRQHFRPLKYLHWYQIVGGLLVAALVWISLVPLNAAPAFPSSDKVGHIVAYLLLTLWFVQIVPDGRSRLLCGGLLIGLGLLLEWAQGLTAYRYTEAADALANALGVGLGLAVGITPLGDVLEGLERGRS